MRGSKRLFWSKPAFPLPEYALRRASLMQALPSNSIALIPAYRLLYSSQNIFYRFHQNRNMLWACGYTAPSACAIISRSDENKGMASLTMFVEEDDRHSMQWTGPKITAERCKKDFGADVAEDVQRLPEFLKQCIAEKKHIYADLVVENDCLDEKTRRLLGDRCLDLKGILHKLRLVKSDAEQRVMANGCKLAAEAVKETVSYVQLASVREEHQVASFVDYACKRRGADGLAYVPVIAGGDRALILHYTHNNQRIGENEMLLMDAGAQVDGYCSDISRTFAVSGHMTEAQRQLYEVVKQTQEDCIALLQQRSVLLSNQPISLDDLHQASVMLFLRHLPQIGFRLQKENRHCLMDAIYPHSIGHYIGLDLHDCPTAPTSTALQPGMTITVEPGLYIPRGDTRFPERFWGIGVRIEDDVLITGDGCTVMTTDAPK